MIDYKEQPGNVTVTGDSDIINRYMYRQCTGLSVYISCWVLIVDGRVLWGLQRMYDHY